jgi:hypothetical protein
MAMPDDENARPSVARSTKHQDDLNKLGRSWFKQARDQSERDEAEVQTWRREHDKWAAFNWRPKFETEFDSNK